MSQIRVRTSDLNFDITVNISLTGQSLVIGKISFGRSFGFDFCALAAVFQTFKYKNTAGGAGAVTGARLRYASFVCI